MPDGCPVRIEDQVASVAAGNLFGNRLAAPLAVDTMVAAEQRLTYRRLWKTPSGTKALIPRRRPIVVSH